METKQKLHCENCTKNAVADTLCNCKLATKEETTAKLTQIDNLYVNSSNSNIEWIQIGEATYKTKKQRSVDDIVDIYFEDNKKTVVKFKDPNTGKLVVTYALTCGEDQFDETAGVAICVLKYLSADNIFTKLGNKINRKHKAEAKAKADAEKAKAEYEARQAMYKARREKKLRKKAKRQAELEKLVEGFKKNKTLNE